jgi:very-short-patch-repair endonuclease
MAVGTANRIAIRARRFQKRLTESEVMLWSRLKGRGLDRPIFRRQVPMGSIIVDFYCPAAKLVVEVDGRTHWDDRAQAKDAARDHWLALQGISVMRIGAGAVYRNLSQVVDGIVLRAEARIAGR